MFRSGLGVFAILVTELFLSPSLVYALDPHRRITQYDMRVYDEKNGMPLHSTKKIFQDSKGFIWIGTQEGLMRFDGVQFKVYDKSTHPGLLENFIWDIAEDWTGNLWVGTYGGGASFFDGEKFATYTTAEGLVNNIVRKILVGSDSTVWFGTDGGVSRLKNGTITNFTRLGTQPSPRINDLFFLDGGSILVSTLDVIRGDTVISIRQNGFPAEISTMCKRRSGGVILGSYSGKLYSYASGSLQKFAPESMPFQDAITGILEDRAGNLWMTANTRGIIRYAKGRFDTLTSLNGLPFRIQGFKDILEDMEGNVWFDNGIGILKMMDSKFVTFGETEGLKNNFGRSVCEDNSGNIWVGLLDVGIAQLTRNETFNYDPAPGHGLSLVYPSPSGMIWFGRYYTLGEIRNGIPVVLKGNLELAVGASALFASRNGDLWVGEVYGKVGRLRGGKYTEFILEDSASQTPPESRVVGSLIVASHGEVLAGTWKAGLYSLRDNRFQRVPETHGLSAKGINSIYEDRDRTLWIATDEQGVCRRKSGEYVTIGVRQGLSFDRLFTVLEDDSANLWCSGNQGIFKVSKQQLNDVADGRSAMVVCEAFNYLDGMRETECNGRWQPSAWKSRDGRLWFVSMAGVVSIDPNNIHRNVVPPPVYVEHVLVDDHKVVQSGDRISLTNNQNNLEIHYTAPSFEVPERVRFEYRLEGYDSTWTQAGTRRIAFYTNLPHGDYRFVVAAFNNDGLRSQTEAGVEFFIAPHWSQTWWFTALSLIGFVAGVGFVFYTVYRFKLDKALAIERIRTSIATDVHDDIKSSWETISLEAQNAKRTILGMRGLDQDESNKLASRFDNIVSLAQEVRDDLRDIIWYVDAKKDTYSDLLGHMKGFAAAKLNTAGIDYEFIHPERETPLSLPIRFRRPVFLIFKEAVTNAQKYSDATRVVIDIGLNHDHAFRMTIADNGKGFDANTVKKGDGLRNMKKRAEEMGAELSILPGQPHGTAVTLLFQLP